jgi:propionyl-CoA carboxylase beta chain
MFEIGSSTVTKISVVTRKAYGFGYFGMCGGRSFGADYAVGWPTAEFCAMGIEGAVNIAFRKDIEAAPDPEKRREELVAFFQSNIGALPGAQGFGIDDIIDPGDTRSLIIRILETMPEGKRDWMPPKKHGIVPI